VHSYQGQFNLGIANGMASITFTDESEWDRFEGMVQAGRMNGIGKLTQRDGTVLEGVWKDN